MPYTHAPDAAAMCVLLSLRQKCGPLMKTLAACIRNGAVSNRNEHARWRLTIDQFEFTRAQAYKTQFDAFWSLAKVNDAPGNAELSRRSRVNMPQQRDDEDPV
ncbi:hypothetical protein EVAR_90060_1 [Eumeta japonica]|uniref:Uncharacterized protein n=1 Tax=Eumeta variegata TaxID=151549 RepID=A0A4C1WXN5_EUMVA|nr:hypothetical protein EVAR_90060_1 [Eumeta japonica]